MVAAVEGYPDFDASGHAFLLQTVIVSIAHNRESICDS
jgi:hypothetical protein